MTIVRVGATKKYSDGWEAAFGKGKSASATASKTSISKKGAKTSAKKKSSKKKSKK